jgi:nicotinamidase-related amidase
MAVQTRYEDIVDVGKIATGAFAHPEDAIRLGLTETLSPAAQDAEKNLVIGIDLQNDFVIPDKSQVADGQPYGSLSVPGAAGDIERFTRFIYNNCDKITRIFLSIDTHFVYQIFHGSMWLDENGNHPAPYTMIEPKHLADGSFRFVGGNPIVAKQCVETLAAAGKGGVFIWPYHCVTGSFGWNLEAQLMQMVHFHSAARKTIGIERPVPTFKGTDIHSEMYGFLEPEFNPKGDSLINKQVLDVLARTDATSGEPKFEYDKIYIAGEAGSHCLLESTRQILKHFANYPDFTQRITILRDCTSPVVSPDVDFAKIMNDAFDDFKRTYGVQIKNSTEIKL